MSVAAFVKTNRFAHAFTNSFLLGNRLDKGGKNTVSGRLNPFMMKFRLKIKGSGNAVTLGSNTTLRGSAVYVFGSNNRINLGNDGFFDGVSIYVIGDDNVFDFGDGAVVHDAEFGFEDDGNSIIAKDGGVKIGGFVQLGMFAQSKTRTAHITAAEGTSITIGKDCAISDGVIIKTSDSHPIFDGDGNRVNHAKSISIGERCWICPGVTILKGAKLGNGCVLGMRAMLTKDFSDKNNTLFAGIPASPRKENISWSLER